MQEAKDACVKKDVWLKIVYKKCVMNSVSGVLDP